MKISKIVSILKHPDFILVIFDYFGIHRLPDKKYLEILFKYRMNKKLDLENPKTFNEKLQWLKLYNKKNIYTKMVDKNEAKEIVAKKIGKKYIISTLGIYDSFDEINFEELPNQFVIKCTHDSGGVIICKDKTNFNINNARAKINKSLKNNFFYYNREWPYKNVKSRIIVEKFLKDRNNKSLIDYKFFCFNGIPKILYVSDGSHTGNQRIAFFDENYNQLNIKRSDYNDFDVIPEKPINFEKMKELSKILSNGIPHLRVDWYEVNGKLYFGEMTFTTCGGFIPFEDNKWDMELGKFIKLPEKDEL